MDRRTLLRRAAALGAIGVAGCTDGGTGTDGGGTPGDTPTPTPSPEPPTSEPPETVEIDEFDFVVTGMDNSSEPTADISFDEGTNTVRVTGTIQGSDGCKTAALESIDYDRAADEVTVAVKTKDRPDAGDGCTTALVFIDYEVTVSFTGGLPRAATVSHNGEDVASGAHDTASAGDDY